MNQTSGFLSSERVQLQPLTVGQALGRAFRLYRRLPTLFWLLLAAFAIPLAVLSSLASQAVDNALRKFEIELNAVSANGTAVFSQFTPQQLTALTTAVLGPAIAVVGVALIGVIIRSVLIDSVLTYITAEFQLGRTVTFGAAVAAVRERWLTLAIGQFLFYLLLLGLALGLAIILFACGLGFGLLAYLYVALGLLITPVLTLERVDATQGLGRAWQLGRARFWPLVAVLVVSFALSLALNAILGLVAGVLPTTLSDLLVSVVVVSVATVVVSPFLPIGVTIIYLDTRLRLEGFGEALRVLEKADPRPADVLPPARARGGFTSNDWVNLALVTAGVFVLLLVYVGLTITLTPIALR